MVALQIRDVPDVVRDALANEARRRGQSLQAFLLGVVEDEAGRVHNRELLAQFDGRTDGSNLTNDEILAEIDASRAERTAQLLNSIGDDRVG